MLISPGSERATPGMILASLFYTPLYMENVSLTFAVLLKTALACQRELARAQIKQKLLVWQRNSRRFHGRGANNSSILKADQGHIFDKKKVCR